MLDFKPLTLEDKELFDHYLNRSKYLTCEYSFTTLYIWRKAFDITYCVYMDSLIVKKYTKAEGFYFMQPIGYKIEDLEAIVSTLLECKKTNNMKFLFRNVEEPFLLDLNKATNKDLLEIGIEENNFDYIYESENLIHLPGRKFAGKRNHFSRFINTYNHRVEDISTENAALCIEASKKWCCENGCSGFLSYELHSIIDMISNIDKLNFKGIVVYVNDVISAFTIGEKVNEDMAIIHIEKAFSNVHGLYTFINKTFASMYFENVKYINREDDMGLEGLRKAKQSYHPLKLERKYTVRLK